jgi:MOSC domain-containing protein YiiM
MRILSVNRGRPEGIAQAKASGVTGIYKRSVATPVRVTAGGLAGDTICDLENHGGPDQAVYVYGEPDYAWWSAALGQQLAPGTFGENLTLTELHSAQLCIGDRLHCGELTLEVTAPRIPCVTLARRMGDSAFLKRFRSAERPGLYCRVIREGSVQTGDSVAHEPAPGPAVAAIELFRDFFSSERDEALIRRHLAAPIAARARRDKERHLAELLAQRGGG